MPSLTLPETGLPGLSALLGGDLWARWRAAGMVFPVSELSRSIRYLRLKPRTSCRMAIFREQDISGGAQPPEGFLVYAFADAPRAEEYFDKAKSGKLWNKEQSYGPFLDRDHAIVAIPFPSDREVPGLRHVYRHHRLKQTVLPFLPELAHPGWRVVKRRTSLRLLSYKTGRRAVFAYNIHAEKLETGARRDTTLHLKAESAETFRVDRLKALWDLSVEHAANDWQLPGIVGWDEARRLTFRRWYPGSVLSSRLTDPASFVQTAIALAEFHRGSVRRKIFPTENSVTAIDHAIDQLVSLLPGQEQRVRRIGDRVATGMSSSSHRGDVLLHGDLHPGQVVFHDGRVVLIDLDRCRYGPPAVDIGSFLAHAAEFGASPELRERFIAAYREHGGSLDSDELRAGLCLGLLQRCARPFRDLAPDWPRLIESRLERLEQALAEGAR